MTSTTPTVYFNVAQWRRSTSVQILTPNRQILTRCWQRRKVLAMWICYWLLQQEGFIWSQFGHDIIYSPLGSFEWHEHISSDIPHIKWDLTNFSSTYITKAQFKSHWVVLPALSFHKNFTTVLCRHTQQIFMSQVLSVLRHRSLEITSCPRLLLPIAILIWPDRR